ncbi:MAG: HEAT repeat domain-containing protein [Elusimicrobia bacterium]|nr:HEAT repeat domain-containing protein [Elusimicrobiota bacterium]
MRTAILTLTLGLAAAAPALAAKDAPSLKGKRSALPLAVAASTGPMTLFVEGAQRLSLVELHDRFVEAVDGNARSAALEEISRSHPRTLGDVKSLFDIFMRFQEPVVRDAVMASVRLVTPDDNALEPAFMEYLKLPESEARIFGINGALRLRSLRARPLIEKIAAQRFSVKSPGESPVLSDKNAWQTQYEALSALAQWQGTKALPLLRKKAGEAPAVGRLMAAYLWKESLPDIARWAGGKGLTAEAAHEALTEDVPLSALRETRAAMLAILRDPKADRELRHRLAIKVGGSSYPEEVDALLAETAKAKDPEVKLSLYGALFASRSPQTIPWLKRLSADDPDPKMRIGALLQLRVLLPAAEVRPLLEAAAAKDPDPENRQSASELLKAPPPVRP